MTGKCPVFEVGDKILIEDPRILIDETDALCTHALSTLLHYVIALERGVDPRVLGLSKDGENSYLQCVDPGEPYTEGGTVVFRIRKLNQKEVVRENG